MIQDFIQWVLQISHLAEQSLTALAPISGRNGSNLLLILYIATIKRSYLFGAAFLFMQSLTAANFFGLLSNLDTNTYGLMFYLSLALIFETATCLYYQRFRNRSVLFWCGTMLAFILLMAWDSYTNADTETFIWRHYESFVVCIHCCLILSFYRPLAVINRLVDSVRRLLAQSHSVNAVRYLLYTVRQ